MDGQPCQSEWLNSKLRTGGGATPAPPPLTARAFTRITYSICTKIRLCRLPPPGSGISLRAEQPRPEVHCARLPHERNWRRARGLGRWHNSRVADLASELAPYATVCHSRQS